MVENSDGRRSPGEDLMASDQSELPDEEIIELSEMTVGISPDDEAIIDLTEEIVGGAFEGYSGATGKIDQEEQVLDLSVTGDAMAPLSVPEGPEPTGVLSGRSDGASKAVAKELDHYFQAESESTNTADDQTITAPDGDGEHALPVNITSELLDDALERVIRKMYGEKIDRILNEMIERAVSDEIEVLKEILASRGAAQRD